ncbi:TraR/DksA family transcriptional regulator [Klebsiella variicola]
MPDEIDRDQEFNEQRLEEMIEQSRFKPAATPSRLHCRFCGKPIPEIRRQTLPALPGSWARPVLTAGSTHISESDSGARCWSV